MLPKELKALKNWIVWKDNKQPYSAVTMKQKGWQKKENWTTFDDAKRVCKSCGFVGVGFVFDYPYVGIDLDHCIEEDGMMNELAREVTGMIDTYTEYSKSGKGLHLYCKVSETIEALKTEMIEIYGKGRFFVVTGKELDAGQDEVTDQTENIKKLIQKYSPVKKVDKQEYVNRRVYTEGTRNNGMTSEVGRLFNFYDKDTVYNLAHTLNQTMCRPPLEDDELDLIIESMSKREVKQMPPKPMEQKEWSRIEGLRDLDEIPYRGITKVPGKYIPTGMASIDYALNDLAPGCVTLVAGRSNGGKTTFVRQVVVNAISLDNKVFIISGEGDQEININLIYSCVIGRDKRFYDSVRVNKRFRKEPKAFVFDALKKWHKGKLKLFDKHESRFKTTDELFGLIEQEVKDNHHNLIVIDNLMSVLTAKAIEKNEAQADFMQRCCDLAIFYKTHIILVLHPNKEYRNAFDFDMEHISGTSDLYNKADNIIAVIREYKQEKIDEGIHGKIKLVKNRYFTDILECETHFDSDTGLLLELKDGKPVSYDFDWMKHIDTIKYPEAIEVKCLEKGDAWEGTEEKPF